MLYLIGLGLADEKDISVKGLEIVRRAARVYLEAYTAILLVGQDELVSLNTRKTNHRIKKPRTHILYLPRRLQPGAPSYNASFIRLIIY